MNRPTYPTVPVQMNWKWTLFVVVLTLVELYVLSLFYNVFGFGETVLLILASPVAGFILMRLEGARCWAKIVATASSGGSTLNEMKNGVLILLAGILMIFPGIITDIIGLLLFLPPIRFIVRVLFLRNLTFEIPRGMGSQFQFYQFGNFSDVSGQQKSSSSPFQDAYDQDEYDNSAPVQSDNSNEVHIIDVQPSSPKSEKNPSDSA